MPYAGSPTAHPKHSPQASETQRRVCIFGVVISADRCVLVVTNQWGVESSPPTRTLSVPLPPCRTSREALTPLARLHRAIPAVGILPEGLIAAPRQATPPLKTPLLRPARWQVCSAYLGLVCLPIGVAISARRGWYLCPYQFRSTLKPQRTRGVSSLLVAMHILQQVAEGLREVAS